MKRVVIALVGLALLLSVAVVPVAAQQQAERGQQHQVDAQARAEEVRQQAEQRTAEIKQQVEARRAQINQEVCQRKQSTLQEVIPHLAQGAVSVKSSLDTVYERVQGFYASGQLTVSNYDELKAKVDSGQAEAAAAVEAAQSYKFELNCDDPNVGAQLDGFRQAVNQAKDALKSYRDQLVALISALRAAAAENAETNQGGSNGQ